VNLIQDTLAALALATDPPTLDLLHRLPEPKGTSLVSFNMWKMIFGQSLVQLTIVFVLNFCGTGIFPTWDDATLKTVIFNTFVWLQIFNEINCRRLDNKLNVFSGIRRNVFFMIIMVIMVGCQTLIIFVGGPAFSVTRLDGYQWLISICLGFLVLPAGAIVRIMPNQLIKKFVPDCVLKERLYSDEERQIEDWDDTIEVIRDDLLFFKRVRGERRSGSVGNKAAGVDANESQLDSRMRRQPIDLHIPNVNGSPSRRTPNTRPYSVSSAGMLVPGLVGLSMALAPATTSVQSTALSVVDYITYDTPESPAVGRKDDSTDLTT
jgi:Ca2+-transporting ATPase